MTFALWGKKLNSPRCLEPRVFLDQHPQEGDTQAHCLLVGTETLVKVVYSAVKPYFSVLRSFPGRENYPSEESIKGKDQGTHSRRVEGCCDLGTLKFGSGR